MAMTWEEMQRMVTSGKPPQYNKAKASAARTAALAIVGGANADVWKAAAFAAVLETAERYLFFTTDQILQAHPELETDSIDPRAWGPVMVRAAKEKVCTKVNGESWKSRRVSNHERPQQVWRSLCGGTLDPRLIPGE